MNIADLTDDDNVTNSDENDLFGMEFSYETIAQDFNNYDIYGQMNGNISYIKWNSIHNNEKRIYGYNYDDTNQLIEAKYGHFSGTDIVLSDTYSVNNLQYDLNGNIETIRRKGPDGDGYIDDLNYHYNPCLPV